LAYSDSKRHFNVTLYTQYGPKKRTTFSINKRSLTDNLLHHIAAPVIICFPERAVSLV